MLSDQKRRVENVNLLIDYHMRKFEEFRLLKMKVPASYWSVGCWCWDQELIDLSSSSASLRQIIMGEMARSNMFYHAKGLELFSVPCAQISTLQARAHGEVPFVPVAFALVLHDHSLMATYGLFHLTLLVAGLRILEVASTTKGGAIVALLGCQPCLSVKSG